MILGLETALAKDAGNVEVVMDSELVVKQLRGEYRVKEPKLLRLYQKVKNLEQALDSVTYYAVPREKNKEADAIVNQVLNEQGNA